MKKLHIDIFVVGDDWQGKYDYLQDIGIKVFYFPYGKGVSSSSVKESIFQKYEKMKSKIDKHGNPEIIVNK